MMPDEMEQKRNHTMYLTNEAIAKADELAETWGIGRNAVFEIAIRGLYGARSATTYAIAEQRAAEKLRREVQDS